MAVEAAILETRQEEQKRMLRQYLEGYITMVTTHPPKGRELPESYSQELFLLSRRWAS